MVDTFAFRCHLRHVDAPQFWIEGSLPSLFPFMSSARLDVCAPAQIVANAKAGLRPKAIAGKVTETDGKIPRLRSVQKTIAKTPDECAPASDGGNIGL